MTFPRYQQVADWIKYTGQISNMQEVTTCMWITPSNYDDTPNVIHYFSSAGENNMIMRLKDNGFRVGFGKLETYTINIPLNQPVSLFGLR